MTHRLLFVCHANVCRSPLMAATFMASLDAAKVTEPWRVDSGGVQAAGGELCAVSAEIVDEVLVPPMAAEFRARFNPALPRVKSLEQSGLIITATREERAALAQHDPALRVRTFTLKEAVSLGAASFTPTELELAADRGVHGYAAILHERRGLAPVPTRRRRLGRQPVDPYDIPDVHHAAPRVHRAGLAEVRDVTRQLFAGVHDYLETGKA